MPEPIHQQRIPGGCYSPEEQVEFALETLLTAARLLEFSGIDELETTLVAMHKPLVFLAAAGLLSDMTFALTDEQGVCGAQATIVPDDVTDFEEADLSALRLLANSQAQGALEIGCIECGFTQEITGTDWLPEATDVLSCSLTSRSDTNEQMDYEEEKGDGDDDDEGWRERGGEDGNLYD